MNRVTVKQTKARDGHYFDHRGIRVLIKRHHDDYVGTSFCKGLVSHTSKPNQCLNSVVQEFINLIEGI